MARPFLGGIVVLEVAAQIGGTDGDERRQGTMTAGMTTRSMEGSRISLPRAGFGALLAGTLLAGSVLGGAVYAGISAATNSTSALATALVATSHESAVRHARVEAGSGPLVGDAGGTQASVTAAPSSARAIPYRGDGFGGDGFDVPQTNIQPTGTTTHALGHGPLR